MSVLKKLCQECQQARGALATLKACLGNCNLRLSAVPMSHGCVGPQTAMTASTVTLTCNVCKNLLFVLTEEGRELAQMLQAEIDAGFKIVDN